jgi:hypothetical protein
MAQRWTPEYADIDRYLQARRTVIVHPLGSNWVNKGFDNEDNLWNSHAEWRVVEVY